MQPTVLVFGQPELNDMDMCQKSGPITCGIALENQGEHLNHHTPMYILTLKNNSPEKKKGKETKNSWLPFPLSIVTDNQVPSALAAATKAGTSLSPMGRLVMRSCARLGLQIRRVTSDFPSKPTRKREPKTTHPGPTVSGSWVVHPISVQMGILLNTGACKGKNNNCVAYPPTN